MRFFSAIAVLLALLLAGSPAFAGKGDVCGTPDGFVFGHTGNGMGGTGIHNGNGMGGTGAKTSERKGMGGTGLNNGNGHTGNGMGGTGSKLTGRDGHTGNGMGGTGITGDIGVYGRVTGFASICVNGMEIEYKKSTPVSNEGSKSSTKDLKVGQIVAVRAYKDKNGEFRARRIMIDKIVSGRVTGINRKRGELKVMKETVFAGTKARGQMKTLREGDFVAVSGLRRADGVIVASHIEKTSAIAAAKQQSPLSLFGEGVKYFSVQGYVESSRDGRVKMTDGTVIHLAKGANARPRENDRVIIFGVVSPEGQFNAETVIPEVKSFLPALELNLLGGEGGLLGPDGLKLPLLNQDGNGGIALPSIPAGGISVPPVDVPPVDVPPVDLPPVEVPGLPPVDLPPIDLPPIDVPALPPIDIPVPPVEVPVIPVPPIIPDLPILPGH